MVKVRRRGLCIAMRPVSPVLIALAIVQCPLGERTPIGAGLHLRRNLRSRDAAARIRDDDHSPRGIGRTEPASTRGDREGSGGVARQGRRRRGRRQRRGGRFLSGEPRRADLHNPGRRSGGRSRVLDPDQHRKHVLHGQGRSRRESDPFARRSLGPETLLASGDGRLV